MIESANGVEVRATDEVRAALARLGRTEDLRFSPGNRRLAIAGFTNNQILFLACSIDEQPSGNCVVSLSDPRTFTSPFIRKPHGVDFIGEDIIAVASRHAGVSVFRVPAGRNFSLRARVPLKTLFAGRSAAVRTPGSVAARVHGDGHVSLFVCNNYQNYVTRHVLAPRRRWRSVHNQVAYRDGLIIPDGVAISGDGSTVAISSHGTQDVQLYPARTIRHPEPAPVGRLLHANYPHGLRFTPDDRHLLVADAGTRQVHVYERGQGWAGTQGPLRSVTVLDEETFFRGHSNVEEGGPKGIDLDRTGRVVAITNEELPLAFFPLHTFTGE